MENTNTIGEQPAKIVPSKGKRKMRPGGGKSKGNGFESQIAKKLSVALAPLNFIRSPGSGSRTGGKNYEKFGQMFGEEAMALFTADVVPINEKKEGLVFLHSIECKSYKTPDNFTSLAAGTANVFKWFEESVTDAAKIDKNPLLIFKWNNTASFVAVNLHHPKCINTPPDAPRFNISYEGFSTKSLSIYYLDDLMKDSLFWFRKVI